MKPKRFRWREREQQEALAKRIETMDRELHRLQSEKRSLEKTMRIRKLLQAGMIFEEAGILDDYNRQEVLAALKRLVEHKRGGDVT